MSVSIVWKIEKRLMVVKFEKNVSIDQVELACRTVTEYIRAGSKPVHVLVDMERVAHYPHEFSKLAGAIPHLAEYNLGKTILVRKSDSLVQLLIKVIRHAVQIDLRLFDSMDKALHYLNETDPTLNLDERTA
ncbi:MAG: hypothetical protein K8I30_00935 [Anaerolineae bacterium]|nr:hypothetical protein [Anaerolineae bacterium]